MPTWEIDFEIETWLKLCLKQRICNDDGDSKFDATIPSVYLE